MVDSTTVFSKDTTLYAVWQRENDGEETGSWSTVNGVLFYRDKDGNVPSGWMLVDGEYHYFNEVGAAMSGWQEIEGSRFYLNADGSKVWGWQTIGENRYYFRFDGMQHSTWLAQGKNLYYLDETGKMVTGSKLIGETECHFGADGNLCMTKEENGSVKQYVVYDRQTADEYLAPDEMALLG
jgi:glucan-binding YG repeat protein